MEKIYSKIFPKGYQSDKIEVILKKLHTSKNWMIIYKEKQKVYKEMQKGQATDENSSCRN